MIGTDVLQNIVREARHFMPYACVCDELYRYALSIRFRLDVPSPLATLGGKCAIPDQVN